MAQVFLCVIVYSSIMIIKWWWWRRRRKNRAMCTSSENRRKSTTKREILSNCLWFNFDWKADRDDFLCLSSMRKRLFEWRHFLFNEDLVRKKRSRSNEDSIYLWSQEDSAIPLKTHTHTQNKTSCFILWRSMSRCSVWERKKKKNFVFSW